MEDTIAAISTSLGVGAISIIRVSGSQAIKICNSIFKGKNLEKVDTHTINHGYIIETNEEIDEVLVSIMRGPKSYTTEDVVEINCHGGISTTNKVLELLLTKGCRLAEPGEFTKRAFLNGRIDLIKAEGIMDLINSKTEKSRAVAMNQLNGATSEKIQGLRHEILKILANIEVNIDYPEYEDIEQVTNIKLINDLDNIGQKLEEIIKSSENGKVLKEGLSACIIGRPNVGKSSILNKLIEEDKAIVTNIEGTTRDIVEGKINIDGILVNFIDTAGIRKTEDIVESIGVKRSIDLIANSDIILFVLNNNEILKQEEINLINGIKLKNYFLLVNKVDLESKIDLNKLDSSKVIYISAKNNVGIEEVKNKIKKLYNIDKIETKDMTYLTNARSISLLKQAYKSYQDSILGIKNNMPVDIIEIDIKKIWELLGEITGETYQEELINQLFNQFCLGK